MNDQVQKTCCGLKEWMVPPVLIPMVMIVMMVIWVALRPHGG
jgi:hypothetical protein